MKSFDWTKERDATPIAMRRDGDTFDAIRLTDLPSVVKPRPYVRRVRPAKRRHRIYDNLQPSKTPFASDDSCPDFAWDDDHCAAVLALGPYPVMPRRAA